MSDSTPTTRLMRPLAIVTGVLLAVGTIGAVVWDDGRDAVANALGRSRDSAGGGATPTTSNGATTTVPGDAEGPDITSSSTTSPASLRADLVVPAAGEYRYEVRVTRDGTSNTVEEVRTVARLDGDDTRGTVQLEVRTGDQRQISILEWASDAVEVRSTRVPTTVDEGTDCMWNPPILEFGPMADGSAWTVDSTCQADVGGVPTTFEVTGSARVVGDVVIDIAGSPVQVWRIERQRTTVISASIGGDQVEQRVEEQGDLFVDPTRGIVVQSDVLVTSTGAQAASTRRQSTLVG